MTSCIDDLRKRLAVFDGRSLTVLGEAEAQFRDRPNYVDALIDLAADPDNAISTGATWLIKSILESGRVLSTNQTRALIRNLVGIAAWQAQLHICQSARHLKISAQDAGTIANWLQPLLTHDRPFVRAWAVDALCRVARQHKRYRRRVAKALDTAAEDPAASVRARARNLLAAVER